MGVRAVEFECAQNIIWRQNNLLVDFATMMMVVRLGMIRPRRSFQHFRSATSFCVPEHSAIVLASITMAARTLYLLLWPPKIT